MNRNTNSRFSVAPQVDIQRSTFKRDSSVKTSFDVGQVIPFYLDEVLAGDTFKIKTSKVCRMQTLKTPMMDDLFIDTYYFFCPSRILWEHFVNFFGENGDSAWIPAVEYTIPQIEAPEGGWNVGTVADYLGIPIGVDGISVNALPFRAVAKCYDEWFRDENLMDPLVIPSGDSTVVGNNGTNYITDVAKGGMPPIACKTHDYFTSALPSPQKGPEVSLNVVGSASVLPVYTIGEPNRHYNAAPGSTFTQQWNRYALEIDNSYPVYWERQDPGGNFNTHVSSGAYPGIFLTPVDSDDGEGSRANFELTGIANSKPQLYKNDAGNPSTGASFVGKKLKDIKYQTYSNSSPIPVNLVADSSAMLQYLSINELRQAFQIQRYYEKCARGGTRFRELLAAHFGTSLGDVRAMIPEYLGGNRLNVNVRQITQTSSTTDASPMGDVAGMSVTTDSHFDFEKSFTEPGYIIGFMVARYHHTYQQGIDPLFQRKGIFDFYWPSFAHLGEMAVKNQTIYAQGNSDDNKVFGYQEAWAEYRYKPNRVSGLMRSAASGSLDTWHFGDYYTELPHLSASWIQEDKTNVDRVLTVSSAISNQIFADIFVENRTTRPMPLYSIPGLIDHF